MFVLTISIYQTINDRAKLLSETYNRGSSWYGEVFFRLITSVNKTVNQRMDLIRRKVSLESVAQH